MNRVGLGLAIGAGYVLGRTKKAKLALAVGSLVAGKKLNLSPRAIAELAGRQLRENPQFKEIGDQLREDLRGAGKAASGAMVERQMSALADRLHGRTSEVREQLTGALSGTGSGSDSDEEEDEGRDDEVRDEEVRDEDDQDRDDDREARDRSSRGKSGAGEKRPAKKAPAKKAPAAEKGGARKAAAKKAPAKKTAAKKTGTARRTAGKKTAAAGSASRGARNRLPKGGDDR